MKLTLRTLIAFLDGTVSDDDAAALRKKIKESEAIRELIERIRHVVSQSQLPALKVTANGLGANPNYPSEYLDSTLDLEKVAEFEKLAIGSDMLLAEVAEAHQILANLGEVDEGVSGRLRNRLYKTTESIYKEVGNEPEMFPVIEDHASIEEEYDDVGPRPQKPDSRFTLAPPRQKGDSQDLSSQIASDSMVAAPPVSRSAAKPKAEGVHLNPRPVIKPPVDDAVSPLSEKVSSPPIAPSAHPPVQSSTSPPANNSAPTRILPIIVATACVTTLIVLIVVSILNRNQDAKDPSQQVAAGDTSSDNKDASRKNDAMIDDDTPRAKTHVPQTGTLDSADEKVEDDDQPEVYIDANPDQGANDSETQTTEIKNRAEIPKAGHGNLNFENLPGDDDAEQAAKDEKKEEVLNLFKDKDYDGKKKKEAAAPENANDPAMAKVDPDKNEDVPKKEKPPAKFTDAKQLMAEAVAMTNGPAVGVMKTALEPTLRRTNLPNAKWISLAQENPVHINDSVVALPGCRSTVEIMDSVRMNLFGYCKVELKENTGKVLPKVIVHSGIVVFENLKEPNNTFDALIQGKSLQITFVDKNSQVVAVSYHVPAETGLTNVIQLGTTKGRAIVKYESEVLSMDENELLDAVGDSYEKRPVKSLPASLNQKVDTLTRSAKEIFFSLSLENPVFDKALAKAERDERSYLRKFAAASAIAMGDMGKLIAFLDDDQNKSFWRETVLATRSLLLSDQQMFLNASRFFEDFASQNAKEPEQGKLLFQYLTLRDDQPLEKGLDAKLVGSLESPSLFMRVGALQTLFALTGKTKFYRPEDKEEKRRKWVKAWEKSMQNGEIRVTTPFGHEKLE